MKKDLQLLSQLYAIHSPTGGEWPLICFIREYVATHIPEAKVRIDRMGNLYIIKGAAGDGYPTLVCHLDQVQALHSPDFEVRRGNAGSQGCSMFNGQCSMSDMLYGWSEQNQRQEGLGADDKNGIWICLRCLEDCPQLKVFMSVGEEKGCIGTNRCDLSFFADSLFVLEPDCKGGEEIHTNLRGIPCASSDFEQALEAEANGMTITDGKTSDILALTLSAIAEYLKQVPTISPRIAAMEGRYEMTDVGQRVVEFGEDGVFIILMGSVVACRDIGATDANTTQGQGENVAGLSGGN